MSTFVVNNSVIPQRFRKKTEGSHPFQIVFRQVGEPSMVQQLMQPCWHVKRTVSILYS